MRLMVNGEVYMSEKEAQHVKVPRLLRGDYSDEQLIEWLNKLLVALEKPKELEETANYHRQSLEQVSVRINDCRELLLQSICNEALDPTQHQ